MALAFDVDAGIGTRANLGVIILATDETLESEFRAMTGLPGVALYHTRIPMVAQVRPDTLRAMEQRLPEAAALFPTSLDFDVIGYACTSAATMIGSDRVAAAVRQVYPGAQVTDPLAAIVAACRALGARRLGFVTPYVPEVSAEMRARLEAEGFAIAAFGSFEEGDDRVVARITPASILAAAEAVAAQGDCEALVIGCTNLRCLGVIEAIEARTGVPAISSNLALGWHMLRLAGIGPRDGATAGRLFSL